MFAPRDRDGSGEAGQTALAGWTEGNSPAGTASPDDLRIIGCLAEVRRSNRRALENRAVPFPEIERILR